MMWCFFQPPTDYRSACTIIPGAYCSANNSEFLPKLYQQDFIVWYSEWRTNIALGSVIVYVCYTLISKNTLNCRGYRDATPRLHHMCSDLKCHDNCTAKIWKQNYILMQRCDDWVKEMTALIVSLTVILLQLYFLSYLKTPKSSIYWVKPELTASVDDSKSVSVIITALWYGRLGCLHISVYEWNLWLEATEWCLDEKFVIYLNDFIFKYRVAVGVNVKSMSNRYYILLILLNINILNVLVGKACLTN